MVDLFLLALFVSYCSASLQVDFAQATPCTRTLSVPWSAATQCPPTSTVYIATATALVPVSCGECDLKVQARSYHCTNAETTNTATVTSETYVLSSRFCISSEALTLAAVDLPKVTITRTTGPVETITQTLHEVMTAAKQRRWKSPHGSPSYDHTRPTTAHWSKPPKDNSQNTDTVWEHQIKTAVKQRRWKSQHGSPSHGHTRPTTVHRSKPSKDSIKDTHPASEQEPTTAVIHRRWKSPHGSPSQSHVEPSDVHESLMSKDSSRDTISASLTKDTDTTTAYISKDKTSTSASTTNDEETPSKISATASTSKATTTHTRSSSTTNPACTTFNPFLAGDFPSVLDNVRNESSGGLLRFACGQTAELEAECPYLCSISEIFLHGCSDTDRSGPISSSEPLSSSPLSIVCKRCNAPTIQPRPSVTCTSVNSAQPPCPSVVNKDDPTVRYQTACGTTTDEIAECPYLCTDIANDHYAASFHCESSDVTGTIFDGSAAIQACVKCLPACQTAR